MAVGLSGAKPQGRGRGRRGRGGGIAPKPQGDTGFGGVNPRGRGMMNPSGQGHPRAGTGQGAAGRKAGVGGAALPGPGGQQLASRVSSGAITQAQANKTMQQRQTLAKALGPDWRSRLQVGGKSFAQVNAGLKKNPGNAKLAALRKKLITNRSSVLGAARMKAKGAPQDEDKGNGGQG